MDGLLLSRLIDLSRACSFMDHTDQSSIFSHQFDFPHEGYENGVKCCLSQSRTLLRMVLPMNWFHNLFYGLRG